MQPVASNMITITSDTRELVPLPNTPPYLHMQVHCIPLNKSTQYTDPPLLPVFHYWMYTLCLYCTLLPHTLHQLKHRSFLASQNTATIVIMHLPVQEDSFSAYWTFPLPTDIRYFSLKLHVVPLLNSRPAEAIPKGRLLSTRVSLLAGYIVPVHGQSSSSSLLCCKQQAI